MIDSKDKMSVAGRGLDGQGMAWSSRCSPARQIVLVGQSFDLEYAFQESQGQVLLNVTFTEVTGGMGQIKMETQGVSTLSLRNEQCLVLLDPSESTAQVPVGDYVVDSCILTRDPNLYESPYFESDSRVVSVQFGETTVLALGTPLNNTLQVQRQKNHLQVTYDLRGTGGERYRFYNWKDRPGFEVYMGPCNIASKTFGYG